MTGKITGISGPTVSVDVKGLTLYERVSVGHSGLTGEVVRLEEKRSIVQVYEDTRGLAVDEPVQGMGTPLMVKLGPGLLSGIFDGLQRPLERLREKTGPFITHCKGIDALDNVLESFENGEDILGYQEWPVRVPRPFIKKYPPSEPLITGQRSIDFLYTVARGGTAIMPGGFGTGKTILEQSIAKYADVDIVVYVGCGERGNEMAELLEEFELMKDPWAQRKLMERTILVVNTSNMPVAAREASIYTAVTMAEYYRDMGLHVLLLADSISRWAEALREISSSLEEMPGEEGYPTYLSSRLSNFMERAGVVKTLNGKTGSLSMILSVSPPGGDLTEPVSQACLRSAGVFLMLDTSLAHRRHFPAINWFQSYSLYKSDLQEHYRKAVSAEWEKAQIRCMEILHKEETLREVTEIVGSEGLQDDDRLLMNAAEKIRLEFLSQNAYTKDAFSKPEKTLSHIMGILDFFDAASAKLKEGIPLDEVIQKK
jgi:V/A-type H+-transporting ATPase subunit A